MMLPR
jgi:hypothetical protein